MSSFPILRDSHYLSFLSPLEYRGANPSTHIADVRYPVQHAGVKSVVKLLPCDGLKACNEAISWMLLCALGLPTPKNAAILLLSEKKAKAAMGRGVVTSEFVNNGYVLAWAAQMQEARSIRALFVGSAAERQWLEVLRTDTGSKVAAFDEVMHNRDRNTGNVLYHGSASCMPIDHEQVFNFQNWQAADLTHSAEFGDSLRVLDRAYRSNKLKDDEWKSITNAMILHSQGYAGALDACRDQMVDLLARLYRPEQGSTFAGRIFTFISARCTDQWMQARVGALT